MGKASKVTIETPPDVATDTSACRVAFEGAVVLITGAARGLGRSYAALCAARGARIVVNDLGIAADGGSPSPEPAQQAAAEICERGGLAVADPSDITTERGAAAVVATALNHFGRLDAVINNAGSVRSGPFADAHLSDLDQMLTTHVRGAFLVTRAAWKVMAGQGYGRVVMTTSSAGLYGQRGLTAYGAAKGALIGLTRALALEGEAFDIHVNAVAPLGYTRLNADLRDLERRALFERHFRVDQVAPLVALLSHRRCPVNGQIFTAGAGRFARVLIAEGVGHIEVDPTIDSVLEHMPEALADHDLVASGESNEIFARSVELTTRTSA